MIQNKFHVVVPVHNAEQWIVRCLESIAHQNYDNFGCVIVEDGSTDKTQERIVDFLREHPRRGKFRLFRHHTKHCPLESIVWGTEVSGPNLDDVIVIVDGDDALLKTNVLMQLNSYYQDSDLWLTYGDFIHQSTGQKGSINKPLYSTENYRDVWQNWCTSHLRTYRHKLWRMIDDSDLREIETGNYYTMAGDLAAMYPMIEMAGVKRIRYIDIPWYLYNDVNPLNEHKVSVEKQWRLAMEISQRQKYERIL
jgi:glycosyltransferase involved in cell wall biosynthesis